MKGVLHFVTKLNFRETKNCSCFWVASYDLFASARKAGCRANGGRLSQFGPPQKKKKKKKKDNFNRIISIYIINVAELSWKRVGFINCRNKENLCNESRKLFAY